MGRSMLEIGVYGFAADKRGRASSLRWSGAKLLFNCKPNFNFQHSPEQIVQLSVRLGCMLFFFLRFWGVFVLFVCLALCRSFPPISFLLHLLCFDVEVSDSLSLSLFFCLLAFSMDLSRGFPKVRIFFFLGNVPPFTLSGTPM